MSHFTVIIIGENIDSQLSKFDKNKIVPKGLVSDSEKDIVLDFYKRNKNFEGTFDECYKMYGDDWNGNSYEKNKNGEWEEFSEYNPDSKWDWYGIGGRWTGFFKLKPGKTGVVGKPGLMTKPSDNRHADQLLKSDIDFEGMKNENESFIPYAIVKDGVWFGKGKMGWWGVSSDDEYEDTWNKKVSELIEGLPDNTLLTLVDCHI